MPVGPALFNDAVAREWYGRVRELAGERAEDLELGTALQEIAITGNRRAAAEAIRERQPHLTVEEILESPKAAIGNVEEVAEQLRRWRDELDLSYFVALEPGVEAFAPVMELLRGD